MKKKETIVEKIVVWAQTVPSVKAIIMEGSMGSGTAKDEFSDYDLNLFVDDAAPFLESEEWFEQFDEILVFQKEDFEAGSSQIPTRLVIYKNSPRVDFSFWPISILESWIKNQELPEFYKNGYNILVDKLGIANQLPAITHDGFQIKQPMPDAFLQNIYNFYFEAAIIAKYLHRKNLWFAAKLSSGPIKDFLQQMILWQTAEKENWNLRGMNSLGKNLEEKISFDLISKFDEIFSEYNLEDCWKCLFNMIDLFDQISRKLSKKLNVEFLDKKIEQIRVYINQIQRKGDDNLH